MARVFMMAGFTDRAAMQHFFQVYANVWADFQQQVFAQVPQVPPTLNGAMPGQVPQGPDTMPAPASVPPPPPVGMSEGPAPQGEVSEPPVVERDMMAPMTQDELDDLFKRAQKPLPVEGAEPPGAVAAPVEEAPAPEKTPKPDRGPRREGNEAAHQEKEGTT